MSPNDLAQGIERKVGEYRAAGIALIWVIYPDTRTAYVYGRARPVEVIDASGTLDGQDVLPGFVLPLAELFAGIPLTAREIDDPSN